MTVRSRRSVKQRCRRNETIRKLRDSVLLLAWRAPFARSLDLTAVTNVCPADTWSCFHVPRDQSLVSSGTREKWKTTVEFRADRLRTCTRHWPSWFLRMLRTSWSTVFKNVRVLQHDKANVPDTFTKLCNISRL